MLCKVGRRVETEMEMGVTRMLVRAVKTHWAGAKVADGSKRAPVVGVLTIIRQQPLTWRRTMVVGTVWQNQKLGVEGGMLCKEGRRVEIEMGVATKLVVVVKIH
jgi:hypothetical protein